MKSIKLLFLLFGLSFSAISAQNTTLSGKVMEKSGNVPIEFANVILRSTTTNKPITGTTTDQNGVFQIETSSKDFYIEFSFLGFQTKKITQFNRKNRKINLGNIYLQADVTSLNEVTITGEKSQTEFKLDKRVFNVGKDLSSTGASALEVLNNVPSVTVNIEGQVSLRGSQGVQMLINGKPSVLANENSLGTITADMIEKIEVITNPSAKYEAEGTSGIINIVLKKEEKKGLNGAITLNTGTPNNHSIGLSLNNRTEKFNLFSQFGFGRRTFPDESNGYNKNLTENEILTNVGQREKNETFYNVVLGTDYHINPLSVITLSGHFAFEQEDENSDFVYTNTLSDNTVDEQRRRTELTEATNPKWQYELQYKKDFKRHKEQSLLFSALGNFFGKDQSSVFQNIYTIGNEENSTQNTSTDFKEAKYTFKLDYTHPFGEFYTLETGSQYVITNVSNDFEIDGSNTFEYDQGVLGLYATTAYENDVWGIKAGLRMEYTDLKTLLVSTNQNNNTTFTDFFPTLHTSYKVSDNFSLQAGYSRRIFRPRLWDLNPFFNNRNPFNIFTGNPNLMPEYSNSYEITSIMKLGKLSLNYGLYHRYTTDVVERVTTQDPDDSNLYITSPQNIGTNATLGLELNAKYSPTNWLTFNGDFNFNSFNRKAQFNTQNFDFNASQWSSRLNSKIKFPADIDMELTGNYRSKRQTLQGERADNLFMDMGLRKKIIKGKVILNLSIRDVFESRVYESIIRQANYETFQTSSRGRFVTFGISYGFGKGEAMEFSGRKRF